MVAEQNRQFQRWQAYQNKIGSGDTSAPDEIDKSQLAETQERARRFRTREYDRELTPPRGAE